MARIESWRQIPLPLLWMTQPRWRGDGADAGWPLLAEALWLTSARAAALLPAPPPRLSQATLDLLTKLRVQVHTGARVSEVLRDGVKLADGRVLPAELAVWAAGVKAPDFLKNLDGLETNRLLTSNQPQ